MSEQKKYFKVKYGFGALDSVSIDEGDLKKAIYAQFKGTPVQLGGVVINGKNIIAITPDYHKYTGWNANYEPESIDDWKQIARDCPNFDGVLEYHKDRLMHLIETGQTSLITEREEYVPLEAPKEQGTNAAQQLVAGLADGFKA